MTPDSYATEFEEEEGHLQGVIAFVDSEIARLEARGPAQAPYQQAANEIERVTQNYLAQLREARQDPYFGRVDFRSDPEEDSLQSYYFGKHHIPDRVSSWTARVAALYYNPTAGGYRVKERFIRGQVELKRQLVVVDSQLLSFYDIVRLPARAVEPALATPPTNPALEQALSAPAEGELREIVETIQPEQYEQIAAGEKPVVIIQGAAGSGKSLVGLHRLAYLLSPFNELRDGLRPRASRVIMLGPSPAFLRFVSTLLPSLGQHDIRQTTFREWMLSSFSTRPRFDRSNRLFWQLMNNRGQPSPQEYQAELFKGSTQMADLLERHVRSLRDAAVSSAGKLIATPPATRP